MLNNQKQQNNTLARKAFVLIIYFLFFIVLINLVGAFILYLNQINSPLPLDESIGFTSSSTKTPYKLDQTFNFYIFLDSPNQSINVVESNLKFDNSLLELESIDSSSSIATIFPIKTFSNDQGTINVVGGILNPGYIGKRNLFIKLSFKAIKEGIAEVRILDTSKVIANDGKGSNVLNNFATFELTIQP